MGIGWYSFTYFTLKYYSWFQFEIPYFVIRLQIAVYVVSRNLLLFTEFRDGKAPVLIATDVASRGLGLLDHFIFLPIVFQVIIFSFKLTGPLRDSSLFFCCCIKFF